MNHTHCTLFFVKVVPGTTFTSWSKHLFVVIGKADQQVRKASHCGLFLLVRATRVLFFTHTPFLVNHTFNTTLTERLQHLQHCWARLFEMTESERDK